MHITLPIAFLVICAATAPAADAAAVRDPFWPVGYAPAIPEPEKPPEPPKPVVKPPEKPKPPPPKPVTEDEWKMARKLLKITGYAVADRAEGDDAQKTSIVIINRKHYQSGETLKIERDGTLFVWRIGEISNNAVELVQDSAVRLRNDVPNPEPARRPEPQPPPGVQELQ